MHIFSINSMGFRSLCGVLKEGDRKDPRDVATATGILGVRKYKGTIPGWAMRP